MPAEEEIMETRKKGIRRLFDGDRFVNFRPVLLLCVAFGLGILLFWLLGLYALFFTLAFLPAVALFLYWKFVKKRRVRGKMLFALLLCAVYAAGSVSLFLHLDAFENAPAAEGDYTVVGVVEEIGVAGFGEVYTLRDVSLIGEDGEEIAAAKKLALYARAQDVRIGMLVYAEADVTTYDAQSYGRINTNAVLGGIRYRATASEVYAAGEERAGVFDAVRGRVRSVLFENLGEETAPVAYAMLLGDSGYMDEDVLQNFRYGGIAHIFAVSGLHIGIVYGILAFFLRKVRLNRWARLPVLAAVLVFYAGICGFSPSSVRALVMCLVLAVADAAGCAYDRLNSVSLASLAVMAIHPVYLFSAGFQLSVAAAAGIIVLGGRLTRLFARIRFIPQRISSAFAVCLSAQICTFPLLLDCFGYASVLGLVLNLVFIPVIGIVYAVLFVCAMLAAAMPFAAGVLLFVPGYMLEAAVTPILLFEFDILLIAGFSFGGLSALYYAAVYAFTDKINLRALPRAVLVGALCLALTVCMLFRNNAFGYDGRLSLHSYYGANNVLLLQGGGQTCLIAAGVPDGEFVERLFLREGVRSLDRVVILGDESDANTAVPVLLEHASVGTLCVPAQSVLDEGWFRTVDVLAADAFSFGCAQAYFFAEDILVLDVFGSRVAVAAEGAQPVPPLPQAELLITEESSAELTLAFSPQREICFRKTDEKTSIYNTGDLQILWNGGIISVSGAG